MFCLMACLIVTSQTQSERDNTIDIPIHQDIQVEEPSNRIELAIETVRDKAAAAYDPELTDEEIELIALVTMAEAEGECEKGKRLVIDTILNRMDSRYFPDTVKDVIYQPYHFESMWNGRVDRCHVSNDICKLVREELMNRTNREVIFFNSGKYSKYGAPLFQVGNHYFSSYD